MAMLICALAVTPIVFASTVTSLWVAVLLVGLAAAAHQGWSANLFTLTSDMFPRHVDRVGRGIRRHGRRRRRHAHREGDRVDPAATGSYVLVFFIAGSAYLVALLVIHLLVPRLEPADLRK